MKDKTQKSFRPGRVAGSDRIVGNVMRDHAAGADDAAAAYLDARTDDQQPRVAHGVVEGRTELGRGDRYGLE